MSRAHPNLREDYFEVIDNKEKAYWLGFLYADGCVYIIDRIKILDFSLSPDEISILKTFCSCVRANKSKIHPVKDKGVIRLRIGSKKMCDDLIQLGCITRKSNIIQLPDLSTRELYLAFLLGYFDGDGTKGTSKITSGSREFLEQIKDHFKINNKIHEKYSDGEINGQRVRGHSYDLYLGAEIFNEMMDNYEYSLPRKRKYFCTEDERVKRIKKNAWHGGGQKKFNITKEELEKLVWEIPATKIAEKYGVSDRLITKRCRQLGIEKPGRGYWAKMRSAIN